MLIISLILPVLSWMGMTLYEIFAKNLSVGIDFLLIALSIISTLNLICIIAVFFYVLHYNRPKVKAKTTVNTRYARNEKELKPRKVYAVTAIILGAVIVIAGGFLYFSENIGLSELGMLSVIFGVPGICLLLLIDYIAAQANK